ncbi:uncharacterized protein CLUP02_02394 [Colletotrichum lupini]|uniref:Uncharacterized protein n=1 Tax=Colletotrichum lupini TaxID=145971 RepID=A0A9Q8WAS7_9PEZI|nr:uncharacterized protein CLUP02_02394 [Colletotrichum lupini]UQC76928.1 hypothetical protein CLUP02_02394 [Colletotrichum lupini]
MSGPEAIWAKARVNSGSWESWEDLTEDSRQDTGYVSADTSIIQPVLLSDYYPNLFSSISPMLQASAIPEFPVKFHGPGTKSPTFLFLAQVAWVTRSAGFSPPLLTTLALAISQHSRSVIGRQHVRKGYLETDDLLLCLPVKNISLLARLPVVSRVPRASNGQSDTGCNTTKGAAKHNTDVTPANSHLLPHFAGKPASSNHAPGFGSPIVYVRSPFTPVVNHHGVHNAALAAAYPTRIVPRPLIGCQHS